MQGKQTDLTKVDIMHDTDKELNLCISEEISDDLKAFFEKQAATDIGGTSTGHNANNNLITYDD